MNKPTATDLDIQTITTQHRLTCALNNRGNKILFRINWQRVNRGFNVAPICKKKSIGVRSGDLGGQAIAPPPLPANLAIVVVAVRCSRTRRTET